MEQRRVTMDRVRLTTNLYGKTPTYGTYVCAWRPALSS